MPANYQNATPPDSNTCTVQLCVSKAFALEQAHPRPLLQFLFLAMQLSPQGLPVEQTLQQLDEGEGGVSAPQADRTSSAKAHRTILKLLTAI